MGLYGLDLIIDRQDNIRLVEINGVKSGMAGFRQIYGDNRVKDEVYSRLEQKYGKLTIDDGTYSIEEFKRRHPILYFIFDHFSRFEIPRKLLLSLFSPKGRRLLDSTNAYTEWMSDKIKHPSHTEQKYEIYSGQESTVLNYVNESVQHPTVNSCVSEDIARNKFLQYLLLKDSEICDAIIPTALIGLGMHNGKTLEKLLLENNLLVVKPILGACGLGVTLMHRKYAEEFIGKMCSNTHLNLMDMISVLGEFYYGQPDSDVKNCVKRRDFSFEYGLGIMQPFVKFKPKPNGKKQFASIRSIVCNGEFIDAYKRVSGNFRANLSQGAVAAPLTQNELRVVGAFSEKAVDVFEQKCSALMPVIYKTKLYEDYMLDIDINNGIDVFVKVLSAVMKPISR